MRNHFEAVTCSAPVTAISQRSRAVTPRETSATTETSQKKCAPCARARCACMRARASARACACRAYIYSGYTGYTGYSSSKSAESLTFFCNRKCNRFWASCYSSEVAHG